MSIIRNSMVALTALLFWCRLHSRRRAMMGAAVQRAIESTAEAVIRTTKNAIDGISRDERAGGDLRHLSESINSDNASPFIQPKLGLKATCLRWSGKAAALPLCTICKHAKLAGRGGGVAALIITCCSAKGDGRLEARSLQARRCGCFALRSSISSCVSPQWLRQSNTCPFCRSPVARFSATHARPQASHGLTGDHVSNSRDPVAVGSQR